MVQTVVEIATEGTGLSKHYGALRVRNESEVLGEIDLDTVSCLVVTARNAVISRSLITELLERGIPAIISGSDFTPQGMILPVQSAEAAGEKTRKQVLLSSPRAKRLWQRVVRAKILHQAKVLEFFGSGDISRRLRGYAKEIQSGDRSNREAVAARSYWPGLFATGFKRNQKGEDFVNGALNYGYAILRSAFARAVCAEGLTPSIGISHSNKRNPFCLVDDLIEPYRPLVDIQVKQCAESATELTPDTKQLLSTIILADFHTSNGTSPLFEVAFYVARQISRYICGHLSVDDIEIPWLTDTAPVSLPSQDDEESQNDETLGLSDHVDNSAL